MELLFRNRWTIFLALIITSIFIFKIDRKIIYKYNKNYNSKLLQKTFAWELKNFNAAFKPAIFSKQGIENIALVTMIKDEEDIIYENLVWHFSVGFRKFVIVDNESTDNTRILVNKFKDKVKGKAQVIIIDDPIVEHLQSAFITSSMKLAHHVWPEVQWVFPVDADEFWYPTRQLSDILQNIPKEKNAIQTLQYNYFPTEKSEEFNSKMPFYKNITCRMKFRTEQQSIDGLIPKMATRPGLEITISQGNHFIGRNKKSNNYDFAKFISGNEIGLNMMHFQRRSVAQVLKKYSNGATANILGQQKGRIGKEEAPHWTNFALEMKNKGIEQAAKDRFNEWVMKDNCIEAPLPMDQAFELFHEITKN